MNPPPEKKSHPWTWALSIAVALPLLYLFGGSPLEFALYRHDPLILQNPMFQAFFAPRDWMRNHAPFKETVLRYDGWWWQQFFGAPKAPAKPSR